MAMNGYDKVGFFGSVTLDLTVSGDPGVPAGLGGYKRDVHYEISLGGGAINAARQARTLQAAVSLVAVLGADDMGGLQQQLLRREFPQVTTAPLLPVSRISLLQGDSCLTSRPPLSVTQPPRDVLEELADCRSVLIGPGVPEDSGVLLRLLEGLPVHTLRLLQLSDRQLRDRQSAAALMGASDLLLINESEACVFAGRQYPDAAFASVRECCCGDVVLTSSRGVLASCAGRDIQRAACAVAEVRRTVGAGDVLAGTLVTGLAEGRGLEESVDLALAAAAIHVAARRMPSSTDELLAAAHECRSAGCLA
ncbi:MAG: carbohydrate kinase family protein [Planctomyces sp.]